MAGTLRIGLTGGIGSGKSEVSRLFAEHAAPIIDTDVIARELVRPGQPALEEIVSAFGQGVLDARGQLDRAALRERVFSDPAQRRRLEAILHPRIRRRALELAAGANAPYCVLVIPLLAETGNDYPLDRVLVVDAPEDLQLQRVQARDDLTPAQTRAILDSQAGREQRLAIADDVIVNDGGLERLREAVSALDRHYRELAAASPRA